MFYLLPDKNYLKLITVLGNSLASRLCSNCQLPLLLMTFCQIPLLLHFLFVVNFYKVVSKAHLSYETFMPYVEI